MRGSLLNACVVALVLARVVGAQQSAPSPTPDKPSTNAATRGQSWQNVEGSGSSRQPAGSIKGRVLGESGQPLANALVLARPVSARGTVNMTSTDAEGNFHVHNLRPTAYQLTAVTVGYVAALDSSSEWHQSGYYRVGEFVTIKMTKGGVITGAVTGPGGNPAVMARVRVVRVLDADGRRTRPQSAQRQWLTDDRGVYRIYGLAPGTYLVSVSGGEYVRAPPGEYNDVAPTYYPSTTRESAAEVVVNNGQETGGIDIRLLGARGYAVSGFVSGDIGVGALPGGISLTLFHHPSGVPEASVSIFGDEGRRKFIFYGVPDGEYELSAQGGLGTERALASFPRRLTVKGASVEGVELRLSRLGSLAGRVVIESAPDAGGRGGCRNLSRAAVEETVIIAWTDEADKREGGTHALQGLVTEGAADVKGDFVLHNLSPGRIRLEARLPGDEWYIRAITLEGPLPDEPRTNVASDGVALKDGERVGGLTIRISEGAAALKGKVVTSGDGARLPAHLSVHLVPSAREQADNAAYYAEAPVQGDGTFSLGNIAPGRYRVLVRRNTISEPARLPTRRAAWDAGTRAALRREAEAAGAVVELKPCQRFDGLSLSYAPQR